MHATETNSPAAETTANGPGMCKCFQCAAQRAIEDAMKGIGVNVAEIRVKSFEVDESAALASDTVAQIHQSIQKLRKASQRSRLKELGFPSESDRMSGRCVFSDLRDMYTVSIDESIDHLVKAAGALDTLNSLRMLDKIDSQKKTESE